ncbi:hypothetical protein SAMN05216529_10973 [Faecalicatena contorta]|uniref:Uncharacterized protein n=1 Tax=Faecalicatena contorta TaxID=39482 RepID=A0A315ZUD1_9FIRM|nr:hypothetical protein A8805_10973 [Faecalicatena contorta]SUQ15022.1 hypothetical protein SAMN05216529_10973 [Faecalicatena contorta]
MRDLGIMSIDLIKIDQTFTNDVATGEYTHLFMRLITMLGLFDVNLCKRDVSAFITQLVNCLYYEVDEEAENVLK